MADNYLEKKMEELRSGKYAIASGNPGVRPGIQRNMLSYPYRRLRVLITAAGRHYLYQYADTFRRQQCQVAIINTLQATDTDLGADHGTRYYTCHDGDTDSEMGSDVADAVSNLIKAWRDVDVMVVLDDIAGLGMAMDKHVEQLPYPNDWGMPVLKVSAGKVRRMTWQEYMAGGETKDVPLPDETERNECDVLPWLSLKENRTVREIIMNRP